MAATERHLRRRRSREGAHRSSAPHAPATGAVISFSNVEKRYSATDHALDGISFDIFPGEFVFLVGHSGSGKSTAMKLLIKELEATAGEIRVAGRDLTKIPRPRVPYYRRNLGVIFQDYKLLPNRTVYENVAYALQVTGGGRREIRDKVPDILRLTGLSTKLHNYPDQLSGGEQQRVAIARAFVNHPPLLIADEPTGNLDPETSIGIMQLLYRINQTGTTVLVATHDVAMVDKMRRRVIELSDGRIVRDEQAGGLRGQRVHARVRDPDAERPGMRPVFFLREALRALKRNAIPSFAAMATVLVTVLVLGVFIPVVQATTGAANEVRGKVIADVYLKTDVQAGGHRPRRPPAQVRADDRQGRVHLQGAGATRPRRSATRRPTSCSAPTRCRTRSASRRPTRTTSARSATRWRLRRPAAVARSSIPRSTRSATAKRTRTRSSPSRTW